MEAMETAPRRGIGRAGWDGRASQHYLDLIVRAPFERAVTKGMSRLEVDGRTQSAAWEKGDDDALPQKFGPLTPQRKRSTRSVALEGVQRLRLVGWASSCSVRGFVGERTFLGGSAVARGGSQSKRSLWLRQDPLATNSVLVERV